MKTKIYLGLAFIGLSIGGCKKAQFGDPVILVTGTEVSPIVKFTVENTPSEYSVTATSTVKAEEDINVKFELDTAAVSRYNAEHKTTYYVVPQNAIDITNLSTVIKAGSSASSAVSVKVISTSPLIDGRSYLIPLSIKQLDGGNMTVLESSRTIFLRIARVIGFPALSMNNSTGATTGTPGTRGRFNACALFDTQNPAMLPNFTLEIKNLIYAYRTGDGNTNPQPIQTIISWENLAENTSIGLRYAELGNPSNSLQLIGSLGSAFAYNFNANQWYTISLAYDGNKCVMYVDGNKVAEVTGSMVMQFSRLNLGQSWGGYDTRQYVNGRIAECRVWSRALTASEIKLNLCGADPNANGLLAYWKMNEGSGNIFHNSSTAGSKYDMDWTKVYWDNAGNGNLVQVDKSAYVTWTNDALNKCSQ
ncbi:MAG: BT_3987 domain-containing protein [Flavisolibacter sp.]